VDSADQGQFDFNSHRGEDGYGAWQDQRRQAMRQLARKLGLPLEHRVEVWIRGEIRLVGILRLREQTLFVPEDRDSRLELIVDNVPFTPDEMTSCVALD
jgi:hypothetical protein